MDIVKKEKPLMFGKVLRSGRKLLGLSQIDLSKKLGISQSLLSKIEQEHLVPSAPMWFQVCELLNIDFRAGMTGYIDYLDEVVLRDRTEVGGFTIPKKYASLQGSTARTALNFLDYFKVRHPGTSIRALVKSLKMDPDYFTILSNPINLNFNCDILDALIEKGLKPADLNTIAKLESESDVHGRMKQSYSSCESIPALVQTLAKNIEKYSVNWQYDFDFSSDKTIVIVETPAPHLKEFSLAKRNLEECFFIYRKSFLKYFILNEGNISRKAKPRAEVFSNVKRESAKCIYKIDLKN